MTPRRALQRLLPATMALWFVAAACSGSSSSPGTATQFCLSSGQGNQCIAELARGAVQLSMIAAQEQLTSGKSLFTFGLTTDQGGLLTGGSPQVFIAKNRQSPPQGPFAASFYQFTPNPEDKSPRSPITGFYAAQVDIPAKGQWIFAAVATIGSKKNVATQLVDAVDPDSVPAPVGSKAISVATPVATTLAKLREICTRDPPDPMHAISLDKALANRKPTVVTFATPLLCQSMLCGPVVDEQLLVFQKYGPQKANFIHVEEFPPGPDHKSDTSTLPSYWQKWGFTTEPWTIVIDRDGIIRARFEGPVTAALIEQALKPLL
jgi:hypothetical protein